ncbi:hypothetical protein ASPZODRAFT_414624 [Penicilliopsis zonata CBS 506.65]|uniref:RNA polymerase II degradation factor 1 n=1 Tax=Penicilliopsis zonata CBS 506.65 TaxID=1073090 RepID=A0A1L9SWG6_9EURO|nr:hypothetical protein ASPZODRAFT_414624 [Penicilliopsis zonata CBS 506.65]OJJ51545.1 hypothetical protein ASPZODRAFT_414624 [Penicilliopsis zonata CBS 506.65]
MSDVQTRPAAASRGRVSARGGRGGYSNRGGRGGSRSTKVDSSDDATLSFEDEGEIGQMKKKYSDTLPTLKELFPDWTDEDLVFALEDSNGDLESAIERITEGNVSQWGEVKKKTVDRTRSKPKEVQSTPVESAAPAMRGSRGRGGFEGRGRARGDRGRGGRGGRAGAHVNGSRPPATASTAAAIAASDALENPVAAPTNVETPVDGEEPVDSVTESTTKDVVAKTAEPAKKGWASLFAKPTPPPVAAAPKKPAVAPAPVPVTPASTAVPAAAAPAAPPVAAPVALEKQAEPVVEQKAPEPVPIPVPVPLVAPAEKTTEEPAAAAAAAPPPAEVPVAETPRVDDAHLAAKDDLTKRNLEQIPDVSAPAPTATAASTTGSVPDPSALSTAATPARPTPSGYPTSAFKQSGRGPAFQRRVMEQQEAVVMPGNHAVDRAAVQFGSMGLNGDATDIDIDEHREEAETRAQPPQHSPVAPRAALPPSTQAPIPIETPAVARPAPGLPPVPQASAAESFNDFPRYTDTQKPYDPFTQQVSQPQVPIQEPFANQAPTQPTVTSGSEYSPFYADQQRGLPYTYYGSYGQSQDATAAQRAATGFGVSGAEVQPHVPTTQPPTRYGHVDTPNSGHNTPNPTLPGATQTPSAQHLPGAQAAAAAAHGGYGYGYPYYSNPHYASYMSQMTQHQYGRNRPMYDDARRYDDHYMQPHSNQYGYGSQYGPYGGKGGMYGQPQHAGFSYEHSSSPATAGSFNQGTPGRDSVYARTGSAQPSESQQSAAGTTAFGTGMSDVFGRPQAGGFSQNQQMAQQQPVTTEEAAKSFETPKAGGPSPSLAQANRPASAANNAPGQPQSQTVLPPLQGQQGQQGFGGYPHLNPQYSTGLGGLGGHQGAYYGNSGRGGWGGNYGH